MPAVVRLGGGARLGLVGLGCACAIDSVGARVRSTKKTFAVKRCFHWMIQNGSPTRADIACPMMRLRPFAAYWSREAARNSGTSCGKNFIIKAMSVPRPSLPFRGCWNTPGGSQSWIGMPSA